VGDEQRGADAPRRLVLARHGRTAWNLAGRGQGHTDVSLDEAGHSEALAAAPVLAAYEPALVWSSDLARARQTAEYVAKELPVEPVYDARLREFDLGRRTGLTMAEFAEQFPDEHAAHASGRYVPVPGAESVEDVIARVRSALDEVLAGLGPGETGLVIGHGTSLKATVVALLGWPPELAGTLAALGNCRQAVLQEVEYAGRLRLSAYNV
jgi:broad specificity phosphatase PhoE